jgi:hypothetical protein
MKGYMCKIAGKTQLTVYLSLKELCEVNGLYYRDASVKRKRTYKQQQAEIIEVMIVKRKRRGKLAAGN